MSALIFHHARPVSNRSRVGREAPLRNLLGLVGAAVGGAGGLAVVISRSLPRTPVVEKRWVALPTETSLGRARQAGDAGRIGQISSPFDLTCRGGAGADAPNFHQGTRDNQQKNGRSYSFRLEHTARQSRVSLVWSGCQNVFIPGVSNALIHPAFYTHTKILVFARPASSLLRHPLPCQRWPRKAVSDCKRSGSLTGTPASYIT